MRHQLVPGARGCRPRDLAMWVHPGCDPAAPGDQRRHRARRAAQAPGRTGQGVVAAMTYTARARRSGAWWAIDVPDLPGVYSQARRLDGVESMARDAIALFLDVDPATLELRAGTFFRRVFEAAWVWGG